ncbi:MAG TPA: alpha/beta hydrolase [Rhodocyclaceae bacterium]|nr:alpha/beta hydrolase [Rhodocyclaceae bacterium]
MEITVAGHSAHIYTGGRAPEPSAPTMVFIHGAELDHSCWNLQARWFAHHGWTVLAPDLPGHGRSGGEPLASVAAIAAWLLALLDAVGVRRAVLVGHSMGSLAALEAAAISPERVSHVALLGNATPMPVSEALLAAARDDEDRARGMINVWSHSARGQIGASAVPGLWLMGMNRRLMERARPGVLHTDLSACNAYRDGLARAANLACPVLILCGGSDQMAPPKATLALAAALPHARRVVLAGAGHALMAEQPDAVIDALRDFLG